MALQTSKEFFQAGTNGRDEYFKNQVTTDPYSPAQFREFHALSNIPEYRNALGCEDGDNLKPLGEEITIW